MKLLYFLQLKCKDCVNNKVGTYDKNLTKHIIIHCLPLLEVMIRNAASNDSACGYMVLISLLDLLKRGIKNLSHGKFTY
jgi:hypothetical protein